MLIKNDPIIPFTDRVRELYREAGVSTVLIIGGSGDYLDIADTVLLMEDYRIHNINERAEQTRIHPFEYYDVKDIKLICWRQNRILAAGTLSAFTSNAETEKYKERISIDNRKITIGDILTDVLRIESIVSEEQVNAIAWICRYIAGQCIGKPINLIAEINAIYKRILKDGLTFLLSSSIATDDTLELPYLFDVMAAISRMSLLVYQS